MGAPVTDAPPVLYERGSVTKEKSGRGF